MATIKETQHSLSANEESLSALRAEVQASSETHRKGAQTFAFKSEELGAIVTTNNAQVRKFLTDIDSYNGVACQSSIDDCKAVQQIQTALTTDEDQVCARILTDIEQYTAQLTKQLNTEVVEASAMMSDANSRQVTTLKTQTSDLIKSADKVRASTEQLMLTIDRDVFNEYDHMQSTCEAFKGSQEMQIKDCLQIARHYQQYGFHTYEATGVTPRKCSYSYPRELARTSPHDRIIARYKMRIQQQLQ